MAAPNLKAITTITGKTFFYGCTSTLASVVENTSASGKVFKINTIRAANVSTGVATVDIAIRRSSVDRYLIKNCTVPPGSNLVLLNKDEYLYLEEGDVIFAKANVNTVIDLTVNYEEIY